MLLGDALFCVSVTSRTSCHSARSRTIIAAAVEASCPENERVILMKPNWDQDEALGLLQAVTCVAFKAPCERTFKGIVLKSPCFSSVQTHTALYIIKVNYSARVNSQNAL